MRQYYWIPRIFGQNQETGTYAVFPPGGWQWVSDQNPNTIPWNPALGLQQRALYLPDGSGGGPAFPRKLLFTGVDIALTTGDPATSWSDFAVWVDPAGRFYNSATPHGAEAGSNFVDCLSMGHAVHQIGQQAQRWRFSFAGDDKVPMDRDQGDLIGVKGGFAHHMGVYVGFRFQSLD